jgi:tRNA uridine 5-carbamoylmethylation protein Kti12
MVGCPGSGKSTYANNLAERGSNIIVISRDVIRFSMISEEDEYFSKEDAVFKEFTRQIDEHLAKGEDVIADATHLNRKSRYKLIKNLKVEPDKINIIYVKTPLDICQVRNAKRKGTRSFVPEEVVERMFYSIEEPNFNNEHWIHSIATLEYGSTPLAPSIDLENFDIWSTAERTDGVIFRF